MPPRWMTSRHDAAPARAFSAPGTVALKTQVTGLVA